jgi:hypothetical protein
MAVRLSALCAGCPLPPGRFLVLSSVRGWADPRTTVQLEGLGRLKIIQWPHRESNPQPAGCSIVPQPTTLLHAPNIMAPIRTYMAVFYDAQHRDSIINNLMDYVPTCSCMDTDIFYSSYTYTKKPLNLASQSGKPGHNTNGSNMRSS